ncbi:NF-kappa-B inhibitor cactus-like isoform X1 [Macrobrachium nipponense]|uniref:NF-kappa-B inhibitor cactus-like isoform X1 n=1 Tax=Macrobrachium nipponense TaxID=159736 RepID=UPI0030C7F73D|nr:Cactus-b splice variant [Macrobrachium nipponense]
MWPVGSTHCQGGVINPSSPTNSSSGLHCALNRDEGARPKTTTSNTTLDISKSHYDSHHDSGFLSGSNLMSSSSIGCDEPHSPTTATAVSMTGGDGGGGGGPPRESNPHDLKSPTTSATSIGHLDSGIDISEQLSSLHLASPTTSASPCSTSSEVDLTNATTRKTTSPRPTRSRLGLNQAQVALLQEIFQTDEDGDTQLHVAVMRGFIEVVYHITRLLPHQAFLDLPNHTGRTALHLAVSTGDSGVARHLVVCGASPVARDRRGNTPLHSASAQGDLRMVTQLTRPVTVAEVMNARLSYAPAHTAGLLAADLTNYDGQTCIHIAAQEGHKEILQHLTWYGADINAREGKSGRTALHYAVEARDQALVAFLAESCRASLTLETYAGLTPYQLALANGATGIANLLLSMGAPGDALPAYLTADDDLDYDEVTGPVEISNGWGGMDDLRIGGVPVPMSMPVSVNDSTPFNPDRYL